MKLLSLAALGLTLTLTACPSTPAPDKTSTFTATLSGANEVPAVTTGGKGTATLTLNETTKKMTLSGSASDLSGAPTMAHIHGPAEKTANAGVLFNLTCAVVEKGCTLSGSADLTDAQIADLKAKKWYVNVHTEANKPGEVRGQLE